jgi:hypothetical protein
MSLRSAPRPSWPPPAIHSGRHQAETHRAGGEEDQEQLAPV